MLKKTICNYNIVIACYYEIYYLFLSKPKLLAKYTFLFIVWERGTFHIDTKWMHETSIDSFDRRSLSKRSRDTFKKNFIMLIIMQWKNFLSDTDCAGNNHSHEKEKEYN